MNKDFNEGNIFTGNKKLLEAVSKIDLKTLGNSTNLSSTSMNRQNDVGKIQQIAADINRKKTQYEADLLNTLKSIERNTANLSEIIGLIQNSNNQQEEMLDLLSEIMSIAKASNKEEAENIWKKVMNNINSTVETADSINKLLLFGMTVYEKVIQNLG